MLRPAAGRNLYGAEAGLSLSPNPSKVTLYSGGVRSRENPIIRNKYSFTPSIRLMPTSFHAVLPPKAVKCKEKLDNVMQH